MSRTARYAILSHTWLRAAPGEVTYSDWIKGELDANHPGYQKLINFCKTSSNAHGLTLGWMDTVCINKDSSAELDESIRTMYKWYRDSAVCVVYLAETTELLEVHADPWFTRGWTLQELLAPRHIKFYNAHWKEIIELIDNDKRDSRIRAEIKRATTITREELVNIRGVSISRRMQWAAKRDVTREEDSAYSLMGLFDVSISIAYGEGAERAFFRLVREVLSSSPNVLDIFNWAGELPVPWKRISSILPSRPHQYLCRAPNIQLDEVRPIDPVTLTHLGLRISVLLMPATSIENIHPSDYIHLGRYYSIVNINPRETTDDQQIPKTYNVLERRIVSRKDGWISETQFHLTLGVLNFAGDETSIHVPKTCLAVGLRCEEEAGRVTTLGLVTKIDTHAPIVFDLGCKTSQHEEDANKDYRIERDKLGYHGMQLVTLYL